MAVITVGVKPSAATAAVDAAVSVSMITRRHFPRWIPIFPPRASHPAASAAVIGGWFCQPAAIGGLSPSRNRMNAAPMRASAPATAPASASVYGGSASGGAGCGMPLASRNRTTSPAVITGPAEEISNSRSITPA